MCGFFIRSAICFSCVQRITSEIINWLEANKEFDNQEAELKNVWAKRTPLSKKTNAYWLENNDW